MRISLRKMMLVLAMAAWTTLACAPAMGATNVATGIIGDGTTYSLAGGDGTGTARFTLTSTTLALNKQARLPDGTLLASDADVAPQQQIVFVLYVDNPTDVVATNLTLSDALNESEFTYIEDSIEIAQVPAGADDATLWNATWQPISDDAGDDVASFQNTLGNAARDRLTVGAVPGQANAQLDVPARTRFAVRFSVTVN